MSDNIVKGESPIYNGILQRIANHKNRSVRFGVRVEKFDQDLEEELKGKLEEGFPDGELHKVFKQCMDKTMTKHKGLFV